MKRGFTLIELMIVIAVLVTLMAITFRIANSVSDTEARTMTITRMQRIENCLSGFHAAFGCYPPVKLQGNRSFRGQEESINWGNESEAWRWVREICRSQPVGCRFPFSEGMSGFIRELSDLIASAASSGEYEEVFKDQDMQEWAAAGFASAGDSAIEGRLSSKKDEVLWSELKLFQYGMMSYLLPRYLVMMGGSSRYFESDGYAQWTKNNDKSCDPFTGRTIEWTEVYEWAKDHRNGLKNENVVKLLLMPSQAACARWMPNLEGICRCDTDLNLFGVHIKSTSDRDIGIFDSIAVEALAPMVRSACFTPDGNGSYRDQYVLDEVTVNDGWGNEFYYYSRSPHQSYTFWSSGPDGRTFPPWIARDQLSGQELDLAAKWTKDDITHMSN
jgi:prepilin-type N-terminal cleavage/methylation domain-containing protein